MVVLGDPTYDCCTYYTIITTILYIKVFVLLDKKIMIILSVLHESVINIQSAQSAHQSAYEHYMKTLVVLMSNFKHSPNIMEYSKGNIKNYTKN